MSSSLYSGSSVRLPTQYPNATSLTVAGCAWNSGKVFGSIGLSGTSELYPWYQVDLGANRTVTGIQLWGRSDYPGTDLVPLSIFVSNTNATVATSNTLISGTPCWTISGTATPYVQAAFGPTGCVGRYVTVRDRNLPRPPARAAASVLRVPLAAPDSSELVVLR